VLTTGAIDEDLLRYGASKLDCKPLKMQCCPKEPARKILRSIYEDARDVARAFADAGPNRYTISLHR